jgi:hypothetical protein
MEKVTLKTKITEYSPSHPRNKGEEGNQETRKVLKPVN